MRQGFKVVKPSAEVMRQMWLTPRGREWARRIAFRELTFAEYVRVPMFLGMAEHMHQSAIPGKLSPEQDEILWGLVQSIYYAYVAGKFKDGHMAAFGFLWKGIAIPGFGWAQVKPALEPAGRAALAYLFGHRYLRLGKPDQAADFFRSAVAEAPAGSPVRGLAQAELDHLGKK
jgi:hypothetical protein